MAVSLSSGLLALSVAAELVNPLDLGSGKFPITYAPNWRFTNGAGANQANEVFSDIRTLTASSTENLDLAGSLTGAFGETLTFTKVKALVIVAAAGNTNDVVVGGAASNGFSTPFGDPTDTVKVKPGGALVLIAPDAAGYAVAAGTGDLLKIANGGSGTGVTYTIVIVGAV